MNQIISHTPKANYQTLLENGYDFNMLQYIAQGWRIFIRNVIGFFSYTILLIVSIGLSFFAAELISENLIMPFISITGLYRDIIENKIHSTIFWFLSSFSYLLGLSYYAIALKINANDYCNFSDVFGFWEKKSELIPFVASIFLICVIPLSIDIILSIKMLKFVHGGYMYSQKYLTFDAVYIWVFLAVFVIIIFYNTLTPMLIMFGGLKWREAMRMSRKIVHKRFFMWLSLYLTLGLALFVVSYIGYLFSRDFFIFISYLFFSFLIISSVIPCIFYATYHNICGEPENILDKKIAEIGVSETN